MLIVVKEKTIPRRLVVIAIFLLAAIAAGALIRTNSAQGLDEDLSAEAQAIRDTILRARMIDIEAAYTFDTEILSTVYINGPRGGTLPPEAVSYIREVRQDLTLSADTLGKLDLMEAVIERRQRDYDLYLAELQSKQEDGTLTGEEKLILEGETVGWPEPDSEAEAAPTQPCTYYPELTPYPGPTDFLPLCGPTPVPEEYPVMMMAPHRGPNPAALPVDAFEIDIISIDIDGDTATAVVHKSGTTSEMVLVHVNGQWCIAGGRLIKSVAP